MSHRFATLALATALGLGFATSHAVAQDAMEDGGDAPAHKEKREKKDKSAQMKEKFDEMDTDANGELSPEEFMAGADEKKMEKMKEKFASLDTDSSGALSLEEFSAKPAKTEKKHKDEADKGEGEHEGHAHKDKKGKHQDADDKDEAGDDAGM